MAEANEAAADDVPGRGRSWLDVLVIVALLVVLAFPWLPDRWRIVVVPMAGLACAVGGARMAAWLDSFPHEPAHGVATALSRLLVPFWVMGLLLVPAMLARGWAPALGEGGFWGQALLWVFPVAPPPASVEAEEWFALLWFFGTLVVLFLFAPVLLWMYRRWTRFTLALPFVVLALHVSGLLALTGAVGEGLRLLLVFVPGWLVGYAFHDGRLASAPRALTGGSLLVAAGVGWAWWHRDPVEGWDFVATPLAGVLVATGVALFSLSGNPVPAWLRRGVPGRLVEVAAARPVTSLLWTGFAAWSAGELLGRWAPVAGLTHVGTAVEVLLTVGLLAVLFFTVGLAEDVGAGRVVRPLPRPSLRTDRADSSASAPRAF